MRNYHEGHMCLTLRLSGRMDLGFSCLQEKPQVGFVHISILRTLGTTLGFCFYQDFITVNFWALVSCSSIHPPLDICSNLEVSLSCL